MAGHGGDRERGKLGEDIAAAFLERRGCTIRERNWRCLYGEIDLIAEDGEYLAFVEVKTRTAGSSYSPLLAMTRRKQNQVRNLALRYIEQTYGGAPAPLQPRFDVVLVVMGRETEVEYLPNSF